MLQRVNSVCIPSEYHAKNYLKVDRPLRWEWVRFPLTNSRIYVAVIFISAMTTASSVADPGKVGSNLSPTVAWRVPECLHIDSPNILNNTCGDYHKPKNK